MNKLLINETPLVVLPSLAVVVGIERAIILQQIQYWINIQGRGKDIGGDIWIWNTYSEWRVQFPFWSERKIMSLVKGLKTDGLLDVKQLAANPYDKTNYYKINHKNLSTLVKTDTTKSRTIKSTQKGTKEGRVTTPSTYKQRLPKDGTSFAAFWKNYPNSRNKQAAIKSWSKLIEGERKEAYEKLQSFIDGLEEWERPLKLHASTYLNNKRWEDETEEQNDDPLMGYR